MNSNDLTRMIQGMYAFKMSRRQALKAAAASSAAAALAARGRAFQASARQDLSGELVFRTWGGAMTDVLQTTWVDPFQEKFGVSVIMDTGELPEVQIQQQKGNPQFDVVALNRNQVHEIKDADVLQTVDASVVPNLAETHPQLASEYAISSPAYFGEMGLVYNTNHVTTAPTSWEELWKPEYEGHVVTPTGTDGGDLFIPPIAKLAGTTWDGDLAPLWAKLEELKPNVLTQYSSAGQMSNLLETEDAWLGPWYNGRAWSAIEQGLPLGYATPSEGATIVLIDMVIPKDAPNLEAAYAFVNFALEAEQQKAFAEGFSYAPARMNVELSEEAQPRMPDGEEGITNLIIPNFDAFAAARAPWAEEWNKIFGAPE